MSADLPSPNRRPRRPVRRPAEAAEPSASAGPPLEVGSRQIQKAATRNRVLAAARELFDTQSYQGTTIREIARHAGVSVGSVFTSFASKGEILSEVMVERLDKLYAELDRLVPHLRGSTADRLRSLFAIFFAVEGEHTKLFLSHIAAAFDWTQPPTARPFGHNKRLVGIIRDCLVKGLESGDVDPAADIEGYVDLLVNAYGWTYRLAITEGADAKAMTEAMDRKIGLIAEGFRPR